MTLSIATVRKTIFSIPTVCHTIKNATLSVTSIASSVVMLSVMLTIASDKWRVLNCYAKVYYADCHFVECRGTF